MKNTGTRRIVTMNYLDKIHIASDERYRFRSEFDSTIEYKQIIKNSKRQQFILIDTPFFLDNKEYDVFSQIQYFLNGGLTDNLSPYLDQIKSGDVKLIIFFTDWWGFCNKNETNAVINSGNLVSYHIYESLYKQFTNIGIISNSVFVSPVSTNDVDQYEDWPIIEFNQPFLRYINFNQILSNINNNQIDKFLFYLNRRIRPHRLITFNNIYKRGLLNNSLFTCHWFEASITNDQQLINYITTILGGYQDSNHDYKNLINFVSNNKLEMTYDPDLNLQCKDEILELSDYASRCFIDLVSEYNCGNHKVFLTEKTARSIVMKLPFIVLGDRGSLVELRSYGFKTFDSVWDESYDLLPTYEERTAAAEELLSGDIMQMYIINKSNYPTEVMDIIEYNYNWYFNEYKYKQIDKFKRIFK